MTDEAAEVVRAHVAAFDAGDVDALLAGFSPDAVFITGSTTAATVAERAELFGGAIEGLAPRMRVESLVSDGAVVACQLTEVVTLDGQELSFSIAAFYRVQNGLIVRGKVYREGSADL